MTISERILIDEKIILPNLPLICVQQVGVNVSHENKTNHEVHLSLSVLDTDKTVKIYYLSLEDYEEYSIQASNRRGLEPIKYQFVIEKTLEVSKHRIPIDRTSKLYFLIVKKSPYKVPLKLKIQEKWEPRQNDVRFLPNIPLDDNRLSKTIRELIDKSKKSVKIISPHTDLHLIDSLSSAIDRDVDVRLIIRNKQNQNTQSTLQAFPHLQRLLQNNLKSNDSIHARLLIVDNNEALVMTSDMSLDSMQNLINCGLHITDSTTLSELDEFYEKIWSNSKNTS